MRRALVATFAIFALLGYTKLIWQSGFDQGADVADCVIASLQNGGKLDRSDEGCQRADAYKRNPLWVLRRRSGG